MQILSHAHSHANISYAEKFYLTTNGGGGNGDVL
jgi:hypothetical protein